MGDKWVICGYDGKMCYDCQTPCPPRYPEDEGETVGYFMPTGVKAVCLSCTGRWAATEGFNPEYYVHIKESYKPLEEIRCDKCNDVILAKKVPDKQHGRAY